MNKNWYGTPLHLLDPQKLKIVCCTDGRFYVSEYQWKDIVGVMRDCPERLTYLGTVGHHNPNAQHIYDVLEERGLTRLGYYEWARVHQLVPGSRWEVFKIIYEYRKHNGENLLRWVYDLDKRQIQWAIDYYTNNKEEIDTAIAEACAADDIYKMSITGEQP